MKVAVSRIEIETFGPDIVVRKYPDDKRFCQVESDVVDKTTTEIGEWIKSRGWYYAGHRKFPDGGHLFTYLSKPGAVILTVDAVEMRH